MRRCRWWWYASYIVFAWHIIRRSYRQFLKQELTNLLDDISLLIQRYIWFVNDGDSRHLTLVTKQYLDAKFTNQWISRCEHISWPSISICYNLFWSYLRQLVCTIPVILWLSSRPYKPTFKVTRNIHGNLDHVRQYVVWQCETYIVVRDQHFRHLSRNECKSNI